MRCPAIFWLWTFLIEGLGDWCGGGVRPGQVAAGWSARSLVGAADCAIDGRNRSCVSSVRSDKAPTYTKARLWDCTVLGTQVPSRPPFRDRKQRQHCSIELGQMLLRVFTCVAQDVAFLHPTFQVMAGMHFL